MSHHDTEHELSHFSDEREMSTTSIATPTRLPIDDDDEVDDVARYSASRSRDDSMDLALSGISGLVSSPPENGILKEDSASAAIPGANTNTQPLILDSADQELLSHIVRDLSSSHFTNHPPFTLQRITELIHDPTKHYSSVSKYLRAIERTLTITSTVHDYPLLLAPIVGIITPGFTTAASEEAGEDDSSKLYSPIPWLQTSRTIIEDDTEQKESVQYETHHDLDQNDKQVLDEAALSDSIPLSRHPKTTSYTPITAATTISQGEIIRNEQEEAHKSGIIVNVSEHPSGESSKMHTSESPNIPVDAVDIGPNNERAQNQADLNKLPIKRTHEDMDTS